MPVPYIWFLTSHQTACLEMVDGIFRKSARVCVLRGGAFHLCDFSMPTKAHVWWTEHSLGFSVLTFHLAGDRLSLFAATNPTLAVPPASSGDSPASTSHLITPDLQTCISYQSVRSGGPNLGPHTCKATVLATVPFPSLVTRMCRDRLRDSSCFCFKIQSFRV